MKPFSVYFSFLGLKATWKKICILKSSNLTVYDSWKTSWQLCWRVSGQQLLRLNSKLSRCRWCSCAVRWPTCWPACVSWLMKNSCCRNSSRQVCMTRNHYSFVPVSYFIYWFIIYLPCQESKAWLAEMESKLSQPLTFPSTDQQDFNRLLQEHEVYFYFYVYQTA